MTRTPRVNDLRRITRDVRSRVAAGLSRKTWAYAGAGLVLAGVAGATTAAGLPGSTPVAAPLHRVSRTVNSAAARTVGAARRPAAPAAHATPAANATPAKHAAPAKQVTHAPAKQAAPARHAPAKHRAAADHARTWAAVSKIVANRTYPKAGHGTLPAQDQLTPVGTSGPQSWLPITPARYGNAKTIVHQAIAKHMGLRAAVIAVATSMQESTLLNLNYGDSDSLGLFQQRPSCGWGSPAQIEHPAYAAGAFLNALHGYQARNPDWARQPLWEAAQGVQASAFPSAYAKWEAQAAHLVASVTKRLV